MNHLLELGGDLIRGTLAWCYPRVCFGCAAPLGETGLPLCAICISRFDRPPLERVITHLEQLPTGNVFTHSCCLWLFDQAGLVQSLHQMLKYGNRPAYGPPFGALIASALDARPPPDVVLPIPLARRRFLTRGYNQAEMLARGLAHRLERPLRTDLLERSRSTQTQTRLDRTARWQNVADAFRASSPPAHVLLVDDVLTTGATLTAAATSLLGAGAERVSFATLAMTR